MTDTGVIVSVCACVCAGRRVRARHLSGARRGWLSMARSPCRELAARRRAPRLWRCVSIEGNDLVDHLDE